MVWLYWQIRWEIEHRRRKASAMREMRRSNYTAEWHDMLRGRHVDWNKYAG